MAPIVLVQNLGISSLTSATIREIAWQQPLFYNPREQGWGEFIKAGIKYDILDVMRFFNFPAQVVDSLGKMFRAFTSIIWHLLSCIYLFWGFGLGVLIVWVLVSIIKWAERGDVEAEVGTGYEYRNLSSQLDSEDEVQDEKCEIEGVILVDM
ncbi:hypothetical protein V8E51_009441 [Hyaloscypha variabilis]|jgi:hypothetical protein